MAAPNNSNTPFDMHKFFNPTNPNSQNPNSTLSSCASYPPPTGPFPYPPQIPQYHYYPQQANMHTQRSISFPTPPLSPPNPNPNPNLNPNHGARLMALLTPPEIQQQTSMGMVQIQPAPSGGSDFSMPILPPVMGPGGYGVPAPMRMLSNKLPRGRHLAGDSAVYDIDVRLPGEVQPQLEVTPITKYGSDPGLVVGRQIAVNKTYICYGLKLGAIRVLNINTALRSLLKGLAQRVTDMAFFAEDVHLLASASVDGRVYIWKLSEGPDENDKSQITGKIVMAIQIVGEGDSVHPRVCWHCHKQEVLVVGIGKSILKIDTTKVGRGEVYSAEEPLICSVDKMIDGVQLVGNHDQEVTDLSMCQWMTTRLVSASVDGTIKIWDDRKQQPIAVFKPHDGRPVNSVTFLTSPHSPEHIILITGGPLNREMKIWVSGSEEGWLLPSDTDSWHCTQTLELKSSAAPRVEDAFFNQVVALSQAGVILLANAKKNAIYAIHLDYGPNPSATRMDYIAEFTVTMPILSFTGTSNFLPLGEPVVQVYCVQTQAIQQYALDLSQCLPPPLNVFERSESSVSRDAKTTEESLEVTLIDFPSSPVSVEPDSIHISITSETDAPPPLSPRLSPKLNETEYSVDRQMNIVHRNISDVPLAENEKNLSQDDIPTVINHPIKFKHPIHLITPSEILRANSSTETSHVNEIRVEGEPNVQDVVNNDAGNIEVEVNVVGETRFGQNDEISPQEKYFFSQASDLSSDTARERFALPDEVADVVDPSLMPQEENNDSAKDVSGKPVDSVVPLEIQPPTPTKGKKQKAKSTQGSTPNNLNSMDSFVEASATSSSPFVEAAFSQIQSMQEMLNQLTSMQKEMQKQMSATVAVPVTKEGKRLEAALGRNLEKSIKANADALWTRFQEESVKQEKLVRDRTQQVINLMTNYVNKDLPALLEKTVKKELAAVGPAIARTLTPALEKIVSTTIVEVFQRGIGDKAVNQLEKAVNSRLEATVARQIQVQFQTSGKQALQESLKSSLEGQLIPAFEMSCKSMFEKVDSTFQKGMAEHASAAQQQFESTNSPLALALRDAINSASSVTRTLSGEVADGQRQLLALAVAGANSKAVDPWVSQLSNGPLGGLHEKVEASVPLDPTKELSRLVSEGKYEEAFTAALQRSDVKIVSWLCSQVDLQVILTMKPLPLSQGVLLSLMQQLAFDMSTDTPRKLGWMTEVAVAINPNDPTITVHVRPIFEQVYQTLNHHLSLPTTAAPENSSARIIMHIIHSILSQCK